ncbi:replication protein [Acinetobacter brisouii]
MNLAHKHEPPQAEVVQFPKQERQPMSNKDEGYTRLPNILIDSEIMANLSDKAFKCLVFIVRQTMGFGRKSHQISISQFQKYCGLKKRDTAMSAIRELEECFLITVERKTGCLNEYSLTLNQYQEKAPVPKKGSTAKRDGGSTAKRDGGSTAKRDGGSTAKRDTNKENFKETLKENFKESESANSPEAILQIWKPNTKALNDWLRRSGEMALTENLIEQVLLEFNPYYESKYRMGLLSENQMYSNFVKWVKRGVNFNSSKSAPKPNSRNVNDVWGEPKQYAPASDIDTEGYL